MKNHFLRKIIVLVLIAAGLATMAVNIGFDKRQVITLVVFSVSILGALLFWQFRVSFAFFGSSILLLTRIITFEEFILHSSMEVILFLIGMMVLVGCLRELGFFSWLLSKTIVLPNLTAKKFMIGLTFTSAFLACILDEVSSIMFMIMLIFEFSDYYEVDPIPFIIASVLATNVGSSGTVIGNPIGLLIAAKASLTFEDFMIHAFPVMVLSVFILLGPLMFVFKKALKELDERIKEYGSTEFLAKLLKVPAEKNLKIGFFIFGATLALLASHHRLEVLLGLEANTILLITPLISASCVMIWRRQKARAYVEKDVEWWTLLFFLFLFAQAGTLTQVGIASFFADKLMLLAEGSKNVLISITLFGSAFISSMLDNVVVVASSIPIVKSLIAIDPVYRILWWALLFGACFGGNMTIIGSTANLIAIGQLEKTRNISISFWQWFKIGFLVGIISLVFVWLVFLLAPHFAT
jgi:Na+/H+ antiporter NhaD/arsenite permease-like protein